MGGRTGGQTGGGGGIGGGIGGAAAAHRWGPVRAALA